MPTLVKIGYIYALGEALEDTETVITGMIIIATSEAMGLLGCNVTKSHGHRKTL